MQQPEDESTPAATDEVRSIRVHGLPPMMDAIYLFHCFYDNAKVLAATALRNRQTGVPLGYGFVEFTSHSDAEFVLESYNGERMPNCNHERFCLTWDTDQSGTRWRVDYAYRECSFFGYDELGKIMDCDRLIELMDFMDSRRPHVTKKRGYLQTVVPNYFVDSEQAFPNDIENQLDHAKSNGSSPAGYLETDLYKRLKLTDTPLTHPNMSQNSGAHTVGQLTQVSTGNLKMLSSKKKEKELYLCFDEEVSYQRNCYLFRTIKLSELLLCSCSYSFRSGERITKCVNCTPKTKQEYQLRQRAWLFTGEKVPPGKEERIPRYMSCCAYGSRIIFAGGMVDPPEAPRSDDVNFPEPESSRDVYCFEPETTIWKKLDWRFPLSKPRPLLFHVNGKIYSLGRTYQGLLEHPTFDSSCGECLLLPEPEINSLGTDYWSNFFEYMLVDRISCAVVGSKIYISSMNATKIPVICFDVNDKEQKWRAVTSFFDGKPFPFNGRALVLDLNGKRDKVMFSFRERLKKYVSLLAVDDNGDISISHEVYLGCTPLALMRNYVYQLSHTYVDLGDQKVAFVTCANKFTEPTTNRCIVFIEICSYEVLDSGCIMSKVLATRTFENNCHSSNVSGTELTSAFVV